jgi:hypothetical protein
MQSMAEAETPSARQFRYQGHIFEPLRNFTAAEESMENFLNRTGNFKNIIELNDYSHAEFYKAAQISDAFCDLYIMDGDKTVAPGLCGLYEYGVVGT